ncbi:hypothetical protein C5E08_11640 [Rathayibacter iranicus]|uniref:Uncharacterized protein n=1 Tax=Rathayibacter iranicus TaxID=59737 RepID=A0AAD1ADI9_9MICO|nr:hypothetical protein C7V51_11785 [Rathayibacter iranicus]PPI44817.1 hypothetical protein C5E09_10500 [Rathayibacter iranicus]PPI59025.1 hypothetical protein C5E08_11640 [Rathayibacter iranicus]PPI70029.1 hypothetical protein C5E01_10695 [Rathayibacter iranicus]
MQTRRSVTSDADGSHHGPEMESHKEIVKRTFIGPSGTKARSRLGKRAFALVSSAGVRRGWPR